MSDTDSRERPFTALPKSESEDAPVRETRMRAFELSEAIVVFVLLLIAAGSGGLIAVYWPWNQGESAANAERLTALEMRLGQLAATHPGATTEASAEERKLLDTLKARVGGDEARLSVLERSGGLPQGADAGPLKLSLDQLSARIAALEATAPPADLAQRLDSFASKTDDAALGARVARLESRDPDAVMKRAAAILALSDLERAGAEGAPYTRELVTLTALLPDAPQFRQLAPFAHSGVATRAMLSAQLSRQADHIIAADREAQAKNWFQKMWLHVEGLVSIRPVGDVKGDSTPARIARAEVAMRGGDLQAAVTQLNGLDLAARAAAKPWVDAANARLGLESALRDLSDRVVAMLNTPLAEAAPSAAAPPPAVVVPAK
ncbi:MAG TPA: hypothetical protein VIJ85_12940 [Rhizomicrobium sp.]